MSGRTADVAYPPIDGTQPCAGEDLEVFFPHKQQVAWHFGTPGPGRGDWERVAPATRDAYYRIEFALAICAECPFRRACLAYALTHDVDGIWGGTTELARRQLRDQHHITAHPVAISDAAARQIDIDRIDAGGGSPLPPSRQRRA